MRLFRSNRRVFLALPLVPLACTKEKRAPLPDLGTLPDLPLQDQQGNRIQLAHYGGKLLLVAFFFTRCPSICPRLIARMQEMEGALKAQSIPVHLAAISVDAEFDQPEVLKRYADARRIDPDSFSLLTGDTKQIAAAAEENFKVGLSGSFDAKKPDLGITHGSHVIVVDPSGRIRAFVRTFDEDAVEQLLARVRELEPPP